MDFSSSVLALCAKMLSIIITVIWFWRVVNWVWLRPKRLEKCLRKQGLKGTSYKFLFGDLKESSKMIKEARSKPITLSDDVVPRVYPFVHLTVQKYGIYLLFY